MYAIKGICANALPRPWRVIVSDYQSALKAWQTGPQRARRRRGVPEAFRIRPPSRKVPEHIAALDRVPG